MASLAKWWAGLWIERLSSSRLTIGALEQASRDRQPHLAWCTTRIAGFNTLSAEYVAVLEKYGMVPSMSRPANPYDNASCESFMKTLKREEIYANKYDDLEKLRANIEEFIEQYYNRQRLHSALGLPISRKNSSTNERGIPDRVSRRNDGVF